MKKNLLLRRLPLISFSILISSFCFSQVTAQWVARYNGPGNRNDLAYALAVDPSGNVYVTGESHRTGIPGTAGDDYLTIKYSKEGTEKWVARYNGPADGFDKATSIAVDGSGNVYVTGWSTGTTGTGTNTDYATVKYNSDGIEQWVARYAGTTKLDDNAEAIAVDASGNVYVTGWSGWSTTTGVNSDYATVKYNAAGIQLWAVRYNGTGRGHDGAFALALDAFNNVYVTGHSLGIGTSSDFATIKYSTTGINLWVARYNGPASGPDRASELFVDDAGNVYVAGEAIWVRGNIDYATIKYSPAGVLRWVARYNGPGNGNDYPTSLKADHLGNVFVTGYSAGDNIDFATVKYNNTGAEQWVARFNGTANGHDHAKALALDASGNIYVTGSGENVDPNWKDYTTIKYNTAGVIQWVVEYNGPAHNSDDHPYFLAVDASGNVYVTGTSQGGVETRLDYATIKYYPSSPITETSKAVTTIWNLPSKLGITNFPNPASSAAKIRYDLPFDGRVAIKVYDILGKERATLVNADKKAGYYNTDFNVSSFHSGVYYFRAVLNGEKKIVTQSGKIIVVK